MIQKKSLLLENRNIYAVTKETMSTNKQRIQKICNELDKQLSNQIKDLYVIENLFMVFTTITSIGPHKSTRL